MTDHETYFDDRSSTDPSSIPPSQEDFDSEFINYPPIKYERMTDKDILYTPDFPDVSQDALAKRLVALLVEKDYIHRQRARGAMPVIQDFLRKETNLSSISEMLALFSIMNKEKYRNRKNKKENAPNFLKRVYSEELEEGVVYPGKIKIIDFALFQGIQNYIRFHNKTCQEIDHIGWDTFFGERRDDDYVEQCQGIMSRIFGGASMVTIASFLRGILPEKRGIAGRASIKR